MGVGVDKAGHQYVALAVDLLIKGPLGADGAHGDDPGALHRHIGAGQDGARLVHQHGGAVVNENGHKLLISFGCCKTVWMVRFSYPICFRQESTSRENLSLQASAASSTSSSERG